MRAENAELKRTIEDIQWKTFYTGYYEETNQDILNDLNYWYSTTCKDLYIDYSGADALIIIVDKNGKKHCVPIIYSLASAVMDEIYGHSQAMMEKYVLISLSILI